MILPGRVLLIEFISLFTYNTRTILNGRVSLLNFYLFLNAFTTMVFSSVFFLMKLFSLCFMTIDYDLPFL
jgi:hypothetical protein